MIIIAGERSGVGKTTITLALLSFLSRQKSKVQSFKVGPDYIDPMFHSAITGRPCRNLDPVLTSETYVRSCFARHCQGADYAIVEGVMGLFDGVKRRKEEGRRDFNSDFASTAHIARLLNLPVLLVIDCSRLSGSVAAIAHGYRSIDPNVKIVGVILNRVGSDRHLTLLKDALEPLNLPILGVLHRQDKITIPDRHLGLVPAAELNYFNTICDRLAHLAETCFDWEKLLPYLSLTTPPLSSLYAFPHPNSPIKIAIARDRAFNFYYQDNLDILEALGAQLIPWSPLEDAKLPDDVGGLYLGGGFPEVFAEKLAQNYQAREAVRKVINLGMPTYAECGGLMYLCDRIIDFENKSWSMVGILPATAHMEKSLTLGYRQATAIEDSLLLKAGETVIGHEFHRSALSFASPSPLFKSQRYSSEDATYTEGWRSHQLHASYLHLHFGDSLFIPQKFLARCLAFLEISRLS